jgi:hypothetical protein
LTVADGSTLATSGAFSQTHTTTAATNVTYPAGTTSNYLISSATQLAANPVTGTPSSTTYLRGDGAWATVSASAGGSTTQVQYNNAGVLAGITGATTNGTALTLTGAILNGTIGATTPTTGAFTTVSASGLITSTVGNSGFILRGSTATNSYIYPVYVTNTSGGVQLALEGATSGNVLVGGTAYATVLTTTTNTPVEIGINTTRVGSFSSTGLSMVKSIGVGNTTPSSSGAGIAFPATQSASTDPNTLDDYETGTWTPSVGGTAVYSAQTGTYTKVGNLVKLKFDLEITAIGTGSSSQITGVPFPSANTGAAITGGVVCYCASLATASLYVGIYIQNSTLYTFTRNTSTTGATTQSAALFGSGTVFFGEITYLST